MTPAYSLHYRHSSMRTTGAGLFFSLALTFLGHVKARPRSTYAKKNPRNEARVVDKKIIRVSPHWLGSTASRRKSGLPRLPTTGDQPARCFFRCVMKGG